MEKYEIKTLYDYLEGISSEYNTPGAKKSLIEKRVRNYPISDDLRVTLNEGVSSGLFEHGFFETDLNRSIKILKEIMND